MSERPAQKFLFHRPKLAVSLADIVTGDAPIGAEPTVCLAAPRRTGKSTFIRHDLRPELENRNILVVYVDLWSDMAADPAHLIAEALKAELRKAESLPVKAARTVGLSKLGFGGVSVDVDKIGQAQGTTLADALEALLERTHKRIALLIDEAQHALMTEAGLNAMFALKAARDRLNTREDSHDGPNLMIVLTGSHRDKLSRLVLNRDQPFFGTTVRNFPLLDRNYTDTYTAWINARLAEDNRFDPNDVFAAFDAVGRQPEILSRILSDAALLVGDAKELKRGLADGAKELRQRVWEDYENTWSGLSPIQRAVAERLAEEGSQAAPFSGTALKAYAEALGETVEAPAVQAAIETLRQKNIVWRSARGSTRSTIKAWRIGSRRGTPERNVAVPAAKQR
ncbi:AAA family ATPase [Azospirillum argentinense]|uniref:AAA family ATPase n=1 Tax=Azospirillum argentinense TaxID=2970906 RepID=UPI001586D9E2|nr:AAA family ATPase [Azospirillum argentinense]